MPTTFTSLLGLSLPATGELAGTWGATVNDGITSLLDSAIAGTTTLSTDADVTLTTTTGAANQARQAILLCSGARTGVRNITAPATSKTYVVINATTGGFGVVIRGAGPTTGVAVPSGQRAVVAWNGADFVVVSRWGTGPSAAVPASVMKIDNLFENSSFPLQNEAGVWSGSTYAAYAFSQEINATTVGSFGDGPLTALFAYANNNGVPQPAGVVGLIASSVARVSNGAVWGANILARNSPGNTNTKLVGLEIDVQPTAGTTVSTTSAGMYINAFNVNMNCPAIQIGGLSGSFAAGLVIGGVTLAGVSPNAGTTMGSLINTGVATYTDGAIVVSNTHKLVFRGSGVGKAPGFVYNDFADNVRLVLGDNSLFVVRDKTDATSLITMTQFSPGVGTVQTNMVQLTGTAGQAALSPIGAPTLGSLVNTGVATYTDGAIVLSNTHQVIFKGTGVLPGSIYSDNANNIRFVLGANNFAVFRNQADTVSVVSIQSVASQGVVNIETAGGEYRLNNTRVVGARDTGWTAMTGTANKATAYDTSTVTLAQLAGRVMALQAALTAHGLIGT